MAILVCKIKSVIQDIKQAYGVTVTHRNATNAAALWFPSYYDLPIAAKDFMRSKTKIPQVNLLGKKTEEY